MKIDPTNKDVFDRIFTENLWRDSHSKSGPGSNFDQTKVLRERLPLFLKERNVKSLLDIPCGDFYWMKEIKGELELLERYIGGDLISELIRTNNETHGDPRFQFQEMDITTSELPKVDLILCRDCLVHLPYRHIFKALRSIKKSGATFLLTTSFIDSGRKNKNIMMGGWRPLNLQKGPFYFPPPEEVIVEHCTENNGIYKDKSLVLWKIKDLSLSYLYVYLVYRKVRSMLLSPYRKFRSFQLKR